MQQYSLAADTKGELGYNILPRTGAGLLTLTSKTCNIQSTHFYQKCKESFSAAGGSWMLIYKYANQSGRRRRMLGRISVCSHWKIKQIKSEDVSLVLQCLHNVQLFIRTEELKKKQSTTRRGNVWEKRDKTLLEKKRNSTLMTVRK